MRKFLMAGALGAALFAVNPAWSAGDVLNVDLVNEPATLDPHMQANHDSFAVYRNIFDNLIARDDDGRIVPEIATAWRQISDTEIEFDIRQGVRFHDGSPLTAADVVFSVRRIINPELRSPQLPNFNRIVAADQTGPGTVRLRTAFAVASYRVEAVDQSPGLAKLVQWGRGSTVTLEPFDLEEIAGAVVRAERDTSRR